MKKRFTFPDYCIYTFLILISVMMILPFYNVLVQSFATPAAIAKQPVYLIPTVIDFQSYKVLFEDGTIWSALRVSFFVTIVGTLINMIVTLAGAYALTKQHLPGRKVFIGLIIFQMLFHGGLVPTYLTIKNYGLLDSMLSMILPVVVNTFYLIIMMNFFKQLPESIEESAKIDGANDIQILIKIVLPISTPTIAAISLFYAVDRWNEWYNAMLYLKDVNKFPMQLFLREMLADISRVVSGDFASELSTNANTYTNGVKMATVIVSTLPVLLVYPWLQRYFTSGISLGAVKE